MLFPFPTFLSLNEIVPLGFLLLSAAYIIFSTVLYYHWRTYSVGVFARTVTLTLYSLLTVPLWLTMGAVAFTYYYAV